MNKPFDNETLRTKTTWTDEELKEEISQLRAALSAIENIGDRYNIVVFDLIHLLHTRESMATARGWKD